MAKIMGLHSHYRYRETGQARQRGRNRSIGKERKPGLGARFIFFLGIVWEDIALELFLIR